MMTGIPIEGIQGPERIWSVTATTSADLQHYIFIVTYKTLIVNGSSIMVVNAPPK
jgi:hypothetical protein